MYLLNLLSPMMSPSYALLYSFALMSEFFAPVMKGK